MLQVTALRRALLWPDGATVGTVPTVTSRGEAAWVPGFRYERGSGRQDRDHLPLRTTSVHAQVPLTPGPRSGAQSKGIEVQLSRGAWLGLGGGGLVGGK